MKKYLCDITGCNKEAIKRKVDVCCGYIKSSKGEREIIYEPFEKPQFRKIDLCKEHLKDWSESTYLTFWNVPE